MLPHRSMTTAPMRLRRGFPACPVAPVCDRNAAVTNYNDRLAAFLALMEKP
jgi:hypothetical protein